MIKGGYETYVAKNALGYESTHLKFKVHGDMSKCIKYYHPNIKVWCDKEKWDDLVARYFGNKNVTSVKKKLLRFFKSVFWTRVTS